MVVVILDIEGTEACATTLKAIFDFCKSIVRFDAFPRQWLTLGLMCFSAIVRLMDVVAGILEREAFIPPAKGSAGFDVQLWTKCFELLSDLCGSDELALEDQTQQRRRAEWIIAGDLRDEGAALLLRLWNAVGSAEPGGNRSGGMEHLRHRGVSWISPATDVSLMRIDTSIRRNSPAWRSRYLACVSRVTIRCVRPRWRSCSP